MRESRGMVQEIPLVVRQLPVVGGQAESEDAAVMRWLNEMAVEERWQPGDELRAYHGRSAYLALYETDGVTEQRLIGALQLVLPDTTPDADIVLPCQRVWPEVKLGAPITESAHVLVLAVRPEWRRTGVYWQLCLALWRYCVGAGIRKLWLEATPTMLRCYRLLGLPLVVRGELRMHWGEPCYPCSLSVREVAGAMAEKALDSRLYRSLLTQAVQANEGDPVRA